VYFSVFEMRQMIWLPEEPLPERLDFDEIFQKILELRQQGKK